MPDSKYDQITDFYLSFVQRNLDNAASLFHVATDTILNLLSDLDGKPVLDLACGEGYLSRILAEHGAQVTGVDISANLLIHARQRSAGLPIRYIQDDAQVLNELTDASFDAAVCNMALMDIPDIRATFRAVRRMLTPDGVFVFVILHPCFETPFRAPEDPVELDENGNFVSVRVRRYLEEGYWNSAGDGMRGRVGAYHRTLGTYVNTLLETGFQLARLVEPVAAVDPDAKLVQKDSRVPTLMAVKAVSNGRAGGLWDG